MAEEMLLSPSQNQESGEFFEAMNTKD